MFRVYAGLRGAGKSYAATVEVERALLAGRNVWSNYRLDFSRNPRHVPVDRCFYAPDIDDLAYMREGLFVFDEAHWKLSSRQWKDLRPETHQYLAQSRKIHMDVILISQSFERLDTIIRELTELVREFHVIGRAHWYMDFRPSEAGKVEKKYAGFGWFIRRRRPRRSPFLRCKRAGHLQRPPVWSRRH